MPALALAQALVPVQASAPPPCAPPGANASSVSPPPQPPRRRAHARPGEAEKLTGHLVGSPTMVVRGQEKKVSAAAVRGARGALTAHAQTGMPAAVSNAGGVGAAGPGVGQGRFWVLCASGCGECVGALGIG